MLVLWSPLCVLRYQLLCRLTALDFDVCARVLQT